MGARTSYRIAFAVRRYRTQPVADASRDDAARLGLRFSPEDPFGLLSTMPFELFRRGAMGVREPSNVRWGTWRGREVRLFDYSYAAGSGDGGRSVELSCALLSDLAAGPHLVVVPERGIDRAATAMGLRGLEFESEGFNRAYPVTWADRAYACLAIEARTMVWLLSLDGAWGFESAERWVLCYGARRWPWEAEQVLETGLAYLDRVGRPAIDVPTCPDDGSAGLGPAPILPP